MTTLRVRVIAPSLPREAQAVVGSNGISYKIPLTSAIALGAFLFSLLAPIRDVAVRGLGILAATGLVATVLGISAVRAVRIRTREMITLVGSALVVTVAIPAVAVLVLRTQFDAFLFLILLTGGIFLGAHIALVAASLLAAPGHAFRRWLPLPVVLGSAGPLLLLIGLGVNFGATWDLGVMLVVLGLSSPT